MKKSLVINKERMNILTQMKRVLSMSLIAIFLLTAVPTGASAANENSPIIINDIVLALDASGSMEGEAFKKNARRGN